MKKLLVSIAVVLFLGCAADAAQPKISPDRINTSQPFPSILMDEDANITLDGGKIKNFRSEPDIGIRPFVQINKTTGRVMMRESSGEWACLGDKVLTSVCCHASNNIVGCNSLGKCWKWDGDEWTQISTSPSMKYVSIGCDGSIIGRTTSTTSDDCYKLVDGAWVAMYPAGVFDRIASYSSTLHYMTGLASKRLYIGNGSTFAVLGDTTTLTSISVAKDGSLFAIKQSDGSLVKWSGSAWGSSLGAATGLKQIAAKSGTMVWAVGSGDTLFYWNGLTWTQSYPGIAVSDISISNF